MNNKKTIAAGFLLFLNLLPLALATNASGGHGHAGSINFVPAPQLMAPVSVDGKVDLKGKDSLIFEWSTEGDLTRRDYYDFRIYKGYSMVASTLVFKERTNNYQIQAKSDLFQNGQVYTWAVMQIDKTGNKSRRNFSSFTTLR